MKTTLKILGLIFLVLYFTACGGGGGSGGGSPAAKTPVTTDPATGLPVPDPSLPADPGTPSTPTAVNVTYYKLTKTTAPQPGWPTKTVTLTGNCVDYQSRTYCWDDGSKVLTWVSAGHTYGPFKYAYFGLKVSSPYSICYGGCDVSFMTSPAYISPYIGSVIITASNDTSNTVAQVLSSGTPVAQSCTEDNGTLTCPDFTVDLNQAAI